MLPSETMIWQPEFTDKTLSRKPGAVHTEVFDRTIDVLIMRLCRKIEINPHWCFASPIQRLASFWSNLS
ncbi:TPA: restriction endonuclease [Escherichia coli]|nr:restriction endonuclease [Escherichia coli]